MDKFKHQEQESRGVNTVASALQWQCRSLPRDDRGRREDEGNAQDTRDTSCFWRQEAASLGSGALPEPSCTKVEMRK